MFSMRPAWPMDLDIAARASTTRSQYRCLESCISSAYSQCFVAQRVARRSVEPHRPKLIFTWCGLIERCFSGIAALWQTSLPQIPNGSKLRFSLAATLTPTLSQPLCSNASLLSAGRVASPSLDGLASTSTPFVRFLHILKQFGSWRSNRSLGVILIR